MYEQSPQIPLSVFRKMVKSLSSEELSRLPAEKLPDHIPLDLIESLPAGKASLLDDLIFQHQSLVVNSRTDLGNFLGARAIKAYDLSMRSTESTPAYELQRSLELLRTKNAERTASVALAQIMDQLDVMERLGGNVCDVRDDYLRIVGARKILRVKCSQGLAVTRMIEAADKKLAHQGETNCLLLSRYYAERCGLGVLVMEAYHKSYKHHVTTHRDLSERLVKLRLELDSGIAADQIAGVLGHESNYVSKLREEIREHSQKLRALEVPLDEIQLTRWLDIVFDFSLYRRSKPQYEQILEMAENNLAELMNSYFKAWERDEVLNDIDQDRFNSVAPEKADAYFMKSESFVRGYFHQKQLEMGTHACIPVSDRLYAFRRLERRLLDVT